MTETDILQAINEIKYYKENGKCSSLPKTNGRDYARTKIGIYLWLGKKEKIEDEMSRLIEIEVKRIKEEELLYGRNNR